MALISVVMSTYNDGPFLARSVKSILTQTFEDFEFIIVNDGSTDNTLRLLNEWARQDSRVTIIDQKNVGLTIALNTGLRYAKGKYIARQDSDDESLPDRLSVQFGILEANPGVSVLGSDIEYVDDAGRYLTTVRNSKKRRLKNKMLKRNEMAHGAVMFPRVINGQAIFYDEFYRRAQDYDLWLRLMELGEIRIVREVLYRVNYRKAGITATYTTVEKEGFARRALENYLLRQKGGEEDKTPVEENSTPRPHICGEEGDDVASEGYYELNCAIRCLSGYDLKKARAYAEEAKVKVGTDPEAARACRRIELISRMPMVAIRLLREV